MSRQQYLVTPPVTPELTERVWGAVQSANHASTRRVRPSRALAGLVLAASLAAGVAVYWGSSREPETWLGRSFESAEVSTDFKLADGSLAELAAHSKLELVEDGPREVGLRLVRGRVSFDVTSKPERRFEVLTPSVIVRVVGTRFSVERSQRGAAMQTHVSVTRGTVRVLRPNGQQLAELHAGQTWSEIEGPDLPVASTPAAIPSVVASAAADKAAVAGSSLSAHGLTAEQLLDQANRARARGEFEVAIAKYEELTRRYPGHAAAGVAALEAGRLRMYSENDPKAAADALERSFKDGDAALREDSLTRLVEAREQAGDVGGCRDAKARYLRLYPQGLHLAEVQRRCLAQPK